VAHYIFNFLDPDASTGPALREHAAGLLRVGMWRVDADEPQGNALASGDFVLIYVGAPVREFIGRAELASAVHDWTPAEAEACPGGSPSGVLLSHVEEWHPTVPMDSVVQRIDPTASNPLVQTNATTGFRAGVVQITADEYETAIAVAAGRAISTG
jgi:hypothetical protein